MNLSFYSIGRFCSQIRLIKPRSEIDLSAITFFSPFALVYLGMYLRHHTSLGYRFNVRPPEAEAAREYLARQQFWERFNFREDTVRRESLRRITTSTSLNDIIDIESDFHVGDEVGDKVRNILISNGLYLSPNKVGLMVGELVDNFAQHSCRNLGALALQYYPRLRALRVAVADCGIGIRASLAENPQHRWLRNEPHHTAALEAFQECVSRKPQGGIGFLDVRNAVDEMGGQLLLSTGDEYISIRKRQVAFGGGMHYDLPGVQIELFLPQGQLIK